MHPVRFFLLFIFSSVLLFSKTSEQQVTIYLQLKWKHAYQFAGFYMAKERGFYREAGLDVEFIEKSPDTNIADEILDGKTLYGVSDSSLVLDRIRGKDVVALGSIFQHSPLILISLRSSGIEKIEDFRGKRAMISTESHQNLSLMAMLKSHNIDEDNIHIIPTSFDLNDLIENNVDLFTAYSTDQPYRLKELGLAYDIFAPSKYGFDFYGDILFTSQKELDMHPERVKRFVQASIKGWYYAFENIDETIDVILKKYNTQNFSREKLHFEALETRKLSGYDQESFGDIDPKKIEEIAKAFALLGYHGDHTRLDSFIYRLKTSSDSKEIITLTDQEKSYLEKKAYLSICTPPDLQPFSFLHEGRQSGMAMDYIKLFEKRVGIPVEPIMCETASESKEKLLKGECDMHISMLDIKSLSEKLNFTLPYLHDNVVLATNYDEPFIPDVTNVSDKIGTLDSTLFTTLKERYPMLKLVKFKSIQEGLEAVTKKEIYGFAFSMQILSFAIQHHFPHQLRISGKFDYDYAWSLAVHKSEPILYNIMNRVITSVKPEEQQVIYDKWISVKYDEKIDYGLIWKIVAAFIVIFALLLHRHLVLLRHQRELKTQQNEIDYMAFHDTLTGLPNRVSFHKSLTEAIKHADRQESMVGILFIDLDRFKFINDSLGHHIGDHMLKVLSQRIAKVLGKNDILARIGGDEFVILSEDIKEADDTALLAKRVLETVNQTISITDYDLRTTASIGIVHYPQDGGDIHMLLKNADNAMYLAKEQGKDNYQFYTDNLSEKIHYRMEIEHDIRNAIENDEFSMVFQPQYDLKSKKIIAAEALLRWKHPKYGFLPPSKFIPVAEDSGFILQVSNWVFIKACETFLEWKEAGIELQHVAINISSIQFLQDNIVQEFQRLIKEVGIRAKEVELEITEHYIMENVEKNLRTLEQLRKIGFKISIDDFGTGYSSMSYLKLLHFDTIKIDKSFIDDIPQNSSDIAITKAILTLAKSLKFKVIAEGIEHPEQEKFLLEHQCDMGQGYLFSKPLNKEEFIRFVKAKQLSD